MQIDDAAGQSRSFQGRSRDTFSAKHRRRAKLVIVCDQVPGRIKQVCRAGSSPGGRANTYRMPGRPFEGISWEAEHIDRAILRFWNASIASSEELVRIRIFVNLDQDERPQIDDPSFAGEFKRYPTQRTGLAIFDVTRAVKAVSGPGRPISFTIILETPGSAFKWEKVELALYVSESID